MGMFDTFKYKCPYCGKKTKSQTKIENRCLNVFWKGSVFNYPHDCIMQMKHPCHKCGQRAAVILKEDKIVDFVKRKEATHKEEAWGYICRRKQ